MKLNIQVDKGVNEAVVEAAVRGMMRAGIIPGSISPMGEYRTVIHDHSIWESTTQWVEAVRADHFLFENPRTLFLINKMLCVPGSHRIYGVASRPYKTATINVPILLDGNCDGGSKADTVQRVETTVLHEVGHTLDLDHCYDDECTMHWSSRLADTDKKHRGYCKSCQGKVRSW